MNSPSRVALLALLLSTTAAHAQTETEEEQLVFVEIAERSVQVPVSFAGTVCGLKANEVLTEFGDNIDPVCSIDEGSAAQMGLSDGDGELVDLTLQDFVSVQLPDGETRVQMPMGFATRLCGLDAGALSDDSMSERQVACELTQEQAVASKLPGLSMGQSQGSTGDQGSTEAGNANSGG